jgi:hypothetical protein
MEKQTKDIKYQDKSYNEKRKILRRFNYTDSNCHELVSEVKYKILKKIKDNKFVDKKYVINMILVDGYVAFEKIFDGDDLIGLNAVDPLTLITEIKDGEVIWHHNKDTAHARVLYDNQILYLSFDDSFTSFVEMIYMNMVNKDKKYTKKLVVDNIVEIYNKKLSDN